MLQLRALWLIPSLFLNVSLKAKKPNLHIQKTCTENLTTSIIIPCSAVHANELNSLLSHLEKQTVLPDEVIISLSECHRVDPSTLQALKQKEWPFKLHLLTSEKVQYAGENRNIACTYAVGDIFILQDADDIPHPQRIEIIKYFFENYDADHLIHHYTLVPNKKDPINTSVINKQRMSFTWKDSHEPKLPNGPFTNGNIAITKDVFKTHQWSNTQRRGQDTLFNKEIYKTFNNCLQLKVSLLYYRQFLSSATSSKKNKSK